MEGYLRKISFFRMDIDMRYLVCEKQVGIGCDYTIGCGMNYYIEEFDGPIEEAVKYFANKTAYPEEDDEEYFTLDPKSDSNLVELFVFPADEIVYADLDGLRVSHKERMKKKKEEATVAKEKAEYLRLKRKFGEV